VVTNTGLSPPYRRAKCAMAALACLVILHNLLLQSLKAWLLSRMYLSFSQSLSTCRKFVDDTTAVIKTVDTPTKWGIKMVRLCCTKRKIQRLQDELRNFKADVQVSQA